MTIRKDASFISVATAVSLAVVGISGGVYVGALATDVQQLKDNKPKIEQIQKSIAKQELKLVEVAVRQEAIQKDLVKQDKKLDKILDKLEEL